MSIPLDALFSLGSTAALLGWVLLAAVPHWRGVASLVAGAVIPGLLATAYAGLVMAWWSRTEGGFGSLDELASAFGMRPLLLAGWLHYLAFDLLIGAWEVREARRRSMPHWSILPALALTLLFGPVGWLVFMAQRAAWSLRGRPLPGIVAAWEPALLAAGLLMAATILPTLAAHLVDDRLFRAEPIWWKPMRFELALSAFLLTLAWLYPMAGPAFRTTRLGRFVVWGAILPSFLEAGYIALQAGRGLASHYNVSTPLYTVLYATMGVVAITLTLTAPALALGLARAPRPAPSSPDSVIRLAAILGLLMTFFLGGLEGAWMSANPGHHVGAPGAGVLPVTGWSRTVGDLRVAHFLGIHAQQALPMVGLAAAAMRAAPLASRIVWAFAAAYALVTLAALGQAMAGLPLIR